MRLLIGSDHAGFEAKEALKPYLAGLGHEVRDAGATQPTSCDYPDYARAVARAVAAGEADRGILVCGTGIGMSIAANKVVGIRAAVLADPLSARLSRSHNDTNVACFGARTQRLEDMRALLTIWLETPFEGGRHAVRLGKIADAERTGG